MSTEATLTHHLQALREGVDEVMRDYTDASVLFTPRGPIRGLAAIRRYYEGFLGNAPPGLIQGLTVTRQDVDGDTAYILWKAEPFIPFATETFVIRDGRIVAQSFAVMAPRADA